MDCGSDAVIDIARNIANGHPGNKLVDYMRYTAMHSGSVKALEDNLNAAIQQISPYRTIIQMKPFRKGFRR